MARQVFFLLLLFISSMVSAAPDGEALYLKHCSACHGNDGKGGVGVPLALTSFLNSVSNEYLTSTIRLGRPGRIMPAFSKLSDAQVKAIVTHLRSWTDAPVIAHDTTPVKGNPENGKKLFTSYCAQCHGENGEGSTGTGVTFSRKRDLPIMAPALNNTGFLSSTTDQMIKDTLIYGREGTPMTSSLVTGLSESDIDDLVSYIRSMESDNIADGDEEEITEDAIVVDSPYTLEETVENLEQAIADQNFTLIRTDFVEHGFVEEGKENNKQLVMHFCNFKFLFDALALDPRTGVFLPCKITVIEKDGKVQVSTINPMKLSKLFNNAELKQACKEMTTIYQTILEDAVL
jgi:cytochrome c oxidase cbb3-type subunit 3